MYRDRSIDRMVRHDAVRRGATRLGAVARFLDIYDVHMYVFPRDTRTISFRER